MYHLIATCVLFTALAGAEPPFYPFQQQRGDLEPYAAAGPPSGPLLLLPGEYVVPVNSPYQQYGAPQVAAEPEQEYQAGFITTSQFSQEQPFGQLQVAPGVQQPFFSAKFTAGNAAARPQPNEKDAEQFNPQVYYHQRKQEQFNNEENDDDKQVQQQKPKNFRGNVRFNTPNQDDANDSSEESVERYQQQDKYKQQKANSRYTASQQSGKYNQQTTNNQYYQPDQQQSNYQPTNNQDQYSRVNKYTPTPPRKYIPVNRVTPEHPAALPTTTEADESSTTTEVATTTEENSNDLNGSKSNYEEGDDVENINQAQGSYYLLLPNGKLQKIVYMTADDLKKMQYIARIQYQTIEPISGPIYAYNPKSAPFVQVF